MIRIHKDSVVPKYRSGRWLWEGAKDELTFTSWKSEVLERELYVVTSGGYKFKAIINQIEEVIYRQEYTRDDVLDYEIIQISDIKNLVLFLAPSHMLTNKFLKFIHTKILDCFLNALIIYFEYFLRLVEFVLIRRDEVSGKRAQIESRVSTKIKRVYAEYLGQNRLLLAREYAEILMGNGDMAPFYHMNVSVKISKTQKDQMHHEDFLAFSTQVVWIAHHRRAYDVIECEMDRLFRSPHFKLRRDEAIEFSPVEQDLLYGKHFKMVNCRRQNSPLIQEIANVERKNLPILWIGRKKYRGNDLRMQQLELEYVIPDSSLSLIYVKHGILGNPKEVYDTMLNIDWEQVRSRYTDQYDPFQLLHQPYLDVPNYDAILKMTPEHLESYFEIKDKRFEYDPKFIRKWKRRDTIIEYIKGGGLVINVVEKCKRELEHAAHGPEISIANIARAIWLRQKFIKKT